MGNLHEHAYAKALRVEIAQKTSSLCARSARNLSCRQDNAIFKKYTRRQRGTHAYYMPADHMLAYLPHATLASRNGT